MAPSEVRPLHELGGALRSTDHCTLCSSADLLTASRAKVENAKRQLRRSSSSRLRSQQPSLFSAQAAFSTKVVISANHGKQMRRHH